jgi:hypothetical protein
MRKSSDVGYRSPPREHRFQPGQSGNPAGRPKASPTFAADLRDELAEIVAVPDGVTRAAVTKQRLIIQRLLREVIAGDLRAITTIVNTSARASAQDDAADEPTAEDRAIVQALGKERKGASPSTATPHEEGN